MSADSPTELLLNLYRPDLDILVSRWGYQPEPTLLPAAYEQLTHDALAAGCCCWLQDIRRRTLNDPDTTRWLLADYFPDMARRLHGRLTVAYLASPALLEAIITSPSFVPTAAYQEQPFVLAFFSDEGEAMEWLHEQRRRPAPPAAR